MYVYKVEFRNGQIIHLWASSPSEIRNTLLRKQACQILRIVPTVHGSCLKPHMTEFVTACS